MKHTEYVRRLIPGSDHVRVYFEKHRGTIGKFIIQYSAKIGNRWRSIMRIDNCHGFPHKHTFYLRKREHVIKLKSDTNSSMTEAIVFITKRFRDIKDNFIRGV